jgi:hypothetical protein
MDEAFIRGNPRRSKQVPRSSLHFLERIYHLEYDDAADRSRRSLEAGMTTACQQTRRALAGDPRLDLTRVLAGPVATRFLAAFGAEVLRIDPPWWDEPVVALEVALGKRCARMDLRKPSSHEAFIQLLREADVLVHGYRPDALALLGFNADQRHVICRARSLRKALPQEAARGPIGAVPPHQGES